MTYSQHQPNQPEFNDSFWKRVGALITSILSDKRFDELDHTHTSDITDSVLERDREAFIRRVVVQPPVNPHNSMVERWTIERRRKDWITKLEETLAHLKTAYHSAEKNIHTALFPLQSALETVSQRMVPVPAYRSAAAVKERTYQPRRRAIEPADLPVFNPLFCTAINRHPIRFSGLKASSEYHIRLQSTRQPDWYKEKYVQTSSEGELSLAFFEMIEQFTSPDAPNEQYIWILSEVNHDGPPNKNWISGLIWLKEKQNQPTMQSLQEQLQQTIHATEDNDYTQSLFEVNFLIAEQFFMQAYDKARQLLLFTPKHIRQENMLPYRETLWQFINQIITEVKSRIEAVAPLFLQIKPEWQAVESLRLLHDKLKEWE